MYMTETTPLTYVSKRPFIQLEHFLVSFQFGRSETYHRHAHSFPLQFPASLVCANPSLQVTVCSDGREEIRRHKMKIGRAGMGVKELLRLQFCNRMNNGGSPLTKPWQICYNRYWTVYFIVYVIASFPMYLAPATSSLLFWRIYNPPSPC